MPTHSELAEPMHYCCLLDAATTTTSGSLGGYDADRESKSTEEDEEGSSKSSSGSRSPPRQQVPSHLMTVVREPRKRSRPVEDLEKEYVQYLVNKRIRSRIDKRNVKRMRSSEFDQLTAPGDNTSTRSSGNLTADEDEDNSNENSNEFTTNSAVTSTTISTTTTNPALFMTALCQIVTDYFDLTRPRASAPTTEHAQEEDGSSSSFQKQRQSNTTWSLKALPIEESVAFSPQPHVLIEADRPHRVFHTNAAYHSAIVLHMIEPIIATSTKKDDDDNNNTTIRTATATTAPNDRGNHQDDDKHPPLPPPLDDLDSRVASLFGAMPVTIHPVLGGEHFFYLLEPNQNDDDSLHTTWRRRRMPPPSLTIG